MFSERETKCPRLKEKKYINHMDFTPLKTQLAKSFLCVATSRPAAAPVPPGTRRPPLPPLFPGGGERRPRGPRAPPRARRRPHLQSRVCPTRTLSFASNFVFFFVVLFRFCFVLDIPRMEQKLKRPPLPPLFPTAASLRADPQSGGKQRAGNRCVHKYMDQRGCWPRSAASATHKWCPWPPPSTPLPVPSPVSARCPRGPAASLPQQPVGKEMRPDPLPGGAAVSPGARDAL